MADSTATSTSTATSASTSTSTSSAATSSSLTSEASLASVYEEARKLYLDISNSSLASTDAKLQEQVARCRTLFLQVAAMVNDMSLFSSNETKEDLQTPFFKYLLVPYYLGHIEQKFVDQQRSTHLREAQQLFTNFLQVSENYELCHPDDRERYTRDQPPDAARRRNELIELAKREKQNKQRLAELTRRKLIANGTIGGGGKIDESAAIVDDELDEIERDIYLVLIDDAVASAVKEIQSIVQELPMVEQFERAREANGGVPPRDERMNQRPPPAGTKPLKLFTIPDARSIRANILKPHWRQPTVSLEEAADIDMQFAIRSENHGIVEKENSDSEDDHSDDDDYYKKKRAWDDFCDDNPAGSGNTYNRS